MTSPATAPRIPALDGWRALSILLVVWGHLVNYRFGTGDFSLVAGYLAVLGVKVFFVISGFLITGLALNEEALTGTLSIKSFYRRRAFRILPAYFVYLSAVLALALAGVITQDTIGIAQASVFVCNIPGIECGWFTGHSWSLAYEEQFYLAFPLLFLLTPRTLKPRLFAAVHTALATAPLLTLLLLPHNTTWESFRVLVSNFSCISAGVLFACHRQQLTALARQHRLISAGVVLFILGCIAVTSGRFGYHGSEIRTAIETLLLPLAIAWLIYRTTVHRSPMTELLELPPVRYIGKISFSLYLWQQMFTSHPTAGELSLLWLLPAAVMSYHLVEQPMVRLGRRTRAIPTTPSAVGASTMKAQ